MKMNFEWDVDKAKANAAKHGITFEEAQTVFNDPLMITYPDVYHSIGESREIAIGESIMGTLLVIAFTERDDRVRIISAREATGHERKEYEED